MKTNGPLKLPKSHCHFSLTQEIYIFSLIHFFFLSYMFSRFKPNKEKFQSTFFYPFTTHAFFCSLCISQKYSKNCLLTKLIIRILVIFICLFLRNLIPTDHKYLCYIHVSTHAYTNIRTSSHAYVYIHLCVYMRKMYLVLDMHIYIYYIMSPL